MADHPLTETAATTTDPVTLARQVLKVEKAHEGLCKRAGLALPASMDDMEAFANAAPDLARAVLAVAELADSYDAHARLERREGDVTEAINTQATADRIRAVLNGDTP